MERKPPVILLVEDDEAHASIMRRALERVALNHSLVHVRDGEEALAYLYIKEKQLDLSEQARPILVLLDLRLPGIAGMEILETVKQDPRTRDVPVIVITTSSAAADVREAFAAGADGYLVKPVDLDAFSDLLRPIGLV